MAEYIEREDLLELYRMDDPVLNKNGHVPLPVIRQNIMDIPAADVAPVRHGRWIDKGEYAVCTECGGRSGTQYDGVEPIPLMTQFCPNCGAKMDEKENDNG